MSEVRNFEDLKSEISSREVREILRKLYGDVRNIDLWPGGILEDPIENSKLGPLFMCIIVNQMKSVRDGDRYEF
jgi:peroxidase